jgi:broad specificity phosphatase PhoE
MILTTILLIRHAQTDWNLVGRWQGHTDIPLNDTGRAQAEALARRLSHWPIRAVYSSDLQRAAATADTLSAALGLTTLYDPNWRERTLGDLEGLTVAEIEVRHPGQWSELRRGLRNLPGCESQAMLRERTTAAFERLVQQHPGEMVAVVSHGGALHALVAHLLGLPIQDEGRFTLRGNTGLTIVEANAHGPRVVLLNDTSHLES